MASLRTSIDQMCKSCVYDPLVDGSWRAQVESCVCNDCPLWDVRPVTGATRAAERKNKAIIKTKEVV